MSFRGDSKSQSGLSLPGVMVALTILAFLSAGVMRMLSNSLNSISHAKVIHFRDTLENHVINFLGRADHFRPYLRKGKNGEWEACINRNSRQDCISKKSGKCNSSTEKCYYKLNLSTPGGIIGHHPNKLINSKKKTPTDDPLYTVKGGPCRPGSQFSAQCPYKLITYFNPVCPGSKNTCDVANAVEIAYKIQIFKDKNGRQNVAGVPPKFTMKEPTGRVMVFNLLPPLMPVTFKVQQAPSSSVFLSKAFVQSFGGPQALGSNRGGEFGNCKTVVPANAVPTVTLQARGEGYCNTLNFQISTRRCNYGTGVFQAEQMMVNTAALTSKSVNMIKIDKFGKNGIKVSYEDDIDNNKAIDHNDYVFVIEPVDDVKFRINGFPGRGNCN